MARKLCVVLLALLVFGCSLRRSGEAPSEDVDKAATLFFERLKAGQYEEIHKDTSQMFKDNQPKAAIMENLQQVGALGRMIDYKRLSTTFEGEGENRIATPTYSVLYDQGAVQIILNFRDEDGEWKLVGFAVKQRGSAA